MVRTPGNSVGVAFPQPRVEVRSASTLGIYIIRCSNSVGVAISEALTTARRASISIEVTPTANRNTYSVARLVGLLPRVPDFARNPGLGKRNSYRVARGRTMFRCVWSIYIWAFTGVSPLWM